MDSHNEPNDKEISGENLIVSLVRKQNAINTSFGSKITIISENENENDKTNQEFPHIKLIELVFQLSRCFNLDPCCVGHPRMQTSRLKSLL